MKCISLVEHVLTKELSTLCMVDIRLTQDDKDNTVCSNTNMLINYFCYYYYFTQSIMGNHQNLSRVTLH